ncbi:MAG TPA: hypothetical protein VLI39_20485 [Sedimentisphaerales bacterium]|nr:hypothetical protein [Sedimentisphaerales bacterium]
MAFRPTKYLMEGELDNTKLGVVTGWVQLAGLKGRIVLNLRGNFHRDIQGAKIRFKGGVKEDDPQAEAYVGGFCLEQNGKVGDITAGLPPFDFSSRPYIEWYSEENGRVVIEPDKSQVEVIGEPVPLDKAIPVSREEQAANLKEFLDQLVQDMEEQRRRSPSGGSGLPPVRAFVLMVGGKPEDK